MIRNTIGHVPAKVKKNLRYEFAYIPRKLVPPNLPIPIQHLRTSPSRKFLTPRAMMIALSIIKSATSVEMNRRKAIADAAGEKAIEAEKAAIDRYNLKCEVIRQRRKAGAPPWQSPYPQQRRFKPKEAIRRAGKRAFKKKFAELNKAGPPEEIEVTISAYRLIKQAKLDPNNIRSIDGDLDRLCEPVGKMFEPLLMGWERRADRKIVFRVSGAWLAPPFVKVPFPLPLNPIVAAFWLWLWSIVVDNERLQGDDDLKLEDRRGIIQLGTLCQRLSIPRKYGAEYNTKQIDNALRLVNLNLDKMDQKERIVSHFEMKARFDGHVTLIAVLFSDVPLPKPKRKIKKVARVLVTDPAPLARPLTRVARVLEPEPAPEPVETVAEALGGEFSNSLENSPPPIGEGELDCCTVQELRVQPEQMIEFFRTASDADRLTLMRAFGMDCTVDDSCIPLTEAEQEEARRDMAYWNQYAEDIADDKPLLKEISMWLSSVGVTQRPKRRNPWKQTARELFESMGGVKTPEDLAKLSKLIAEEQAEKER